MVVWLFFGAGRRSVKLLDTPLITLMHKLKEKGSVLGDLRGFMVNQTEAIESILGTSYGSLLLVPSSLGV